MRDWSQYNVNTIRTGSENGKRLAVLFAIDFKGALGRDIDKNFTTCGRCAKREINNFLKFNKMEKKAKKSFKVKLKYQGLALAPGSKTTMPAKNPSDEICAQFANEHPRGLDLFDSIPEDFEIGQSYGEYTPGENANGGESDEFKNADEIKKAYTRDELNDIAEKLGLDGGSYSNKSDVAEAIFNAMSSDTEDGDGDNTEEEEE
jgi:hypothetical protein